MKLPKNWSQITIGQFQELQLLTEPSFDNQLKTLSILSGKKLDEIEEMRIVDITAALAKLAFMAELPTAKNVGSFRIGNTLYKFAANQHHLQAHQFIMVQDLFAEKDKWVQNLHTIMAALCVPYRIFPPKRKEVKTDDFEKIAAHFRERMPISFAYAYTLFFSLCLPELLETTQAYLEQEVEKLRKIHAEKTAQQSHGLKP
jgi:hypothetical protein